MHECVEKKHHKDGFVQSGCAPIIHCMDLKLKAEHMEWIDLSLAWIEKALITNLSWEAKTLHLIKRVKVAKSKVNPDPQNQNGHWPKKCPGLDAPIWPWTMFIEHIYSWGIYIIIVRLKILLDIMNSRRLWLWFRSHLLSKFGPKVETRAHPCNKLPEQLRCNTNNPPNSPP